MSFLLAEDLKTHLYDEQIAVIDRADDSLLTTAISAAEAEAKGYLSRYDINTIFGETVDNRDAILLLWLKDIATWHFIPLSNAGADMEYRESRYKQGIAWLKGIQAGKIVPDGWPLTTVENQDTQFHVSSDTKRTTQY